MREIDEKATQQQDGLFIGRRQTSSVIVVLIMFAFVLFAAGYYWGHRSALQDFGNQIEQDTLNDRIALSLGALRDKGEVQTETDLELELLEAQTNNASQQIPSKTLPSLPPAKSGATEQASSSSKVEVDETGKQHVARLIGYGYLKPAKRLADKLTRQGIPVKVEKRTSTTKRGKKRVWYQVITQPYSNKIELQDIVNTIARREHITGITIITI